MSVWRGRREADGKAAQGEVSRVSEAVRRGSSGDAKVAAQKWGRKIGPH